MASLAPDECLRLAPGVRMQFEPAQNRYVLLYPEGMVQLNDEAAAILNHCDGKKGVAAILEQLQEEYDGPTLADDVHNFLSDMVSHDLLRSC